MQQEKRFLKLDYESFYLLKVEKTYDKYILKISGSTNNVYSVSINKESMTIDCDCPDSKSWARTYNCYCKHICFVLLRIFKDFYSKQSTIFLDKKIKEEDYVKIEDKLKYLDLNNFNDDVVNKELIEKFKKLDGKNEFQVEDFEVDLCPICFLDIESDVIKCPECKKLLHIECMEKWLNMGNTTCVYCRSEVWKNYKTEYLRLD